jgi:hypothetical protein
MANTKIISLAKNRTSNCHFVQPSVSQLLGRWPVRGPGTCWDFVLVLYEYKTLPSSAYTKVGNHLYSPSWIFPCRDWLSVPTTLQNLSTCAIYRSSPELAAQWLHKLRRHLQRNNELTRWRNQRDIFNTSPTARFHVTSVLNFEETGPRHNSGGHKLCSSSSVPRILTHRSVSLLRRLQSLSHSRVSQDFMEPESSFS